MRLKLREKTKFRLTIAFCTALWAGGFVYVLNNRSGWFWCSLPSSFLGFAVGYTINRDKKASDISLSPIRRLCDNTISNYELLDLKGKEPLVDAMTKVYNRPLSKKDLKNVIF
jgi:hypothetical protein